MQVELIDSGPAPVQALTYPKIAHSCLAEAFAEGVRVGVFVFAPVPAVV
jgi:hypothetical protein